MNNNLKVVNRINMASILPRITKLCLSAQNPQLITFRTYAARKYQYRFEITPLGKTKKPKKMLPVRHSELESVGKSLAARGFLRPLKAYNPPPDLYRHITGILEESGIDSDPNTPLESADTRFKVLQACFNEFGHGVPNSTLFTIKTVGDLLNFYQTPIDTTTPYDALKTMNLPENLHIQYEYHRFHPDTDTKFGGKSIFPKSSGIITGLKAKKKYKSWEWKPDWMA